MCAKHPVGQSKKSDILHLKKSKDLFMKQLQDIQPERGYINLETD